MKPLITIIINVYNGEKYIKKCLESVIKQTYNNLEILIINDGSTDNTLKICNTYKDNRIKIITTKNQGLSLSRNTGIEKSKGEYLFFVDVDDFIEKDTIEYLYNLCKKNNVLMATCNSLNIYNYNFNKKNKKEKIKIETGKKLLKKILLANTNDGTIWNKLIKKELFNNLRFEDRIINDVVVVYKLALKLEKYAYSNQTKYYYYRHSESIMGKHKPKRDIDFYKASIERYNYIKNIYPKLIENEICLLISITVVKEHNNIEADKYLEKENAKKLFDKLFTLKILFYNIRINRKIKIILYRISPKLFKKIINSYLKNKKN